MLITSLNNVPYYHKKENYYQHYYLQSVSQTASIRYFELKVDTQKSPLA